MAVENGALIATDRKGTARSFPLGTDTASPARHVTVMAEPYGAFRTQWAILDGNGEALVLGYLGDWDSLEMDDIERAARLAPGIENLTAPRTQIRHDGMILQDGTWWKLAPRAGMLAFVLAGITGSGALPAVLGWPVVAALLVFLVVGMTSGAYGKHRRGKSGPAHDAILAGDHEAFKREIKEAGNPSKTIEPEPPEGAT